MEITLPENAQLSTNTVYRRLLEALGGELVSSSPRGQPTQEILGVQTEVDLLKPIITIPSRKLNYRFMVAEAYWILTGQQGLDQLLPYCGNMSKFSDDGLNLSGAYGPRFVSQVRYVVDKLVEDPESRQAVMTLWERNPRASKDIPCTVAIQWIIRGAFLHCIVFMRSSDAWLGWPYDVFSFSMMTQYVRLSLQQRMTTLILPGSLRIIAGSQHLYQRDRDKAYDVAWSPPKDDGDMPDMSLDGINTPGDLLCALGAFRNVPNHLILDVIKAELCKNAYAISTKV